MIPIQCPDCDTHLHGADRCRCGWVMASVGKSITPGVERRCFTVGCPAVALVYSKFCANCDTRQRQEKSAARCAELGLVTVDQKREYCRRMARSFGRGPSFEAWAKNITQRTVDIIALQAAGQTDQCLERLRAVGAIDGRNKVIPVGQARDIAADAYRMAKVREAALFAQELAERGEVKTPEPAP